MSRQRSGGSASFPDAASFAAILPEHDDYLRGVAWAVVREPSAMDDVMQTTYEKAYTSLESFDGRSSLRTWLHTICYRTAIDYVRRESRHRRTAVDKLDTLPQRESTSSLRSMSDDVDQRMEASEVLARLDPEQRVLLYYTAGLGYSYDEVAQIVNMSRGTVASKVSRAKERLRKGIRYE